MDKVQHFEIPVDDRDRASAFYTAVFGWQMNHMPEMEYTLVGTVPVDEHQMPTESGAINGGLMQRSEATPTPVITISVGSVDDSLKKIEAEGGSVVVPRTPIPGMGAFAYFKDSEGNTMGLFETE
ncbi:MAG TPA: VOC family protein [Actinomycetota bacterium]